jgi:protein pelota
MKIIGKRISKWKDGYVTLYPTSDEDMWHIYNLIRPGDWIREQVQKEKSLK